MKGWLLLLLLTWTVCTTQHNSDLHHSICLLFRKLLTEATSEILGGPEKYMTVGSSLRLVCVLRDNTQPPSYVFWYHDEQMINFHSTREVSTPPSHPFLHLLFPSWPTFLLLFLPHPGRSDDEEQSNNESGGIWSNQYLGSLRLPQRETNMIVMGKWWWWGTIKIPHAEGALARWHALRLVGEAPELPKWTALFVALNLSHRPPR